MAKQPQVTEKEKFSNRNFTEQDLKKLVELRDKLWSKRKGDGIISDNEDRLTYYMEEVLGMYELQTLRPGIDDTIFVKTTNTDKEKLKTLKEAVEEMDKKRETISDEGTLKDEIEIEWIPQGPEYIKEDTIIFPNITKLFYDVCQQKNMYYRDQTTNETYLKWIEEERILLEDFNQFKKELYKDIMKMIKDNSENITY